MPARGRIRANAHNNKSALFFARIEYNNLTNTKMWWLYAVAIVVILILIVAYSRAGARAADDTEHCCGTPMDEYSGVEPTRNVNLIPNYENTLVRYKCLNAPFSARCFKCRSCGCNRARVYADNTSASANAPAAANDAPADANGASASKKTNGGASVPPVKEQFAYTPHSESCAGVNTCAPGCPLMNRIDASVPDGKSVTANARFLLSDGTYTNTLAREAGCARISDQVPDGVHKIYGWRAFVQQPAPDNKRWYEDWPYWSVPQTCNKYIPL